MSRVFGRKLCLVPVINMLYVLEKHVDILFPRKRQRVKNMSKYFSSILEIICGKFGNHSFDGRLSLRNKGGGNEFVFAMGAGILKLSLGECYLLD